MKLTEQKPTEKSKMPITKNLVATSNFKPSRKYQSKRVRQNKRKLLNIKNREKRLQEYGWSLYYFK